MFQGLRDPAASPLVNRTAHKQTRQKSPFCDLDCAASPTRPNKQSNRICQDLPGPSASPRTSHIARKPKCCLVSAKLRLPIQTAELIVFFGTKDLLTGFKANLHGTIWDGGALT
eukprot:CAMPEP_0203958154 /NCGR_PEP_ID=MMETSP0359-20131031/89721_1 /ASSEMBLY_ACC=CAM_ASM_000338 /TAXON_ID=268821 /ORGANISM="Scrippsiella Hangoei, Strain SHTV-5" /LENGTH=113 /DNA_ID=CAMNT_0050892069 /DNA_START=402 /DNA_END=741 /DNA_ORIENTATION=+